MEYSQKIPFGVTRTSFTFAEDHLDYMIYGEKSDFGFSVPYDAIASNQSLNTVSEMWPLYVAAAIWAACLLDRIADKFQRNHDYTSPSFILFWIMLALSFLFGGLYKLYFKNDAKLIRTNQGNIIVLNDSQQKTICDEITTRRKSFIRKRYADINPFNNPAGELAKLQRFKEEGIISDAEYAGFASQISLVK